MAADRDSDDLINENLIESFRLRLRTYVAVDPVLDHLHFLDAEQKERVRQRARTDGDSAAVDVLIDAVLRKPHPVGWFQAFVDALSNAECKHAADYMRGKLPDPKVEAENDDCMRMIDILVPSLLDMSTKEVCTHCFSHELISKDDRDKITHLADNQGLRDAARELLKRIVRCPPGWYSKFIKILQDTEHQKLYDLLGGSSDSSITDESTKSNPVKESQESSTNQQHLDHKDTGDDTIELYRSESSCKDATQQSSGNAEQLPQEVRDSDAAAGGPDKADIVLRDYQMDVAKPALEGENIIICLPTGSGKTRVAVYIARQHLDDRRAKGKTGKVVILVNTIPLVEQHYSTEFHRFLKQAYKVERVSGKSMLKISFTDIVKKNDVIICTAQILENCLEESLQGEDKGLHLKDITLMIIDECHHTKKGEVYNRVMMHYLKLKNKNRLLKKEQKETVPLPQILGLTASIGVGDATKLESAVKNILQICASLDASQIRTGNLGVYSNEPDKQIVLVEDKEMDPFGDVIKRIMRIIQDDVKLSPTCELGSQNYEQWVVQCEQQAAKEEAQEVRVCVAHLRWYNDALMLSNTIRMRDAFSFLNKKYEEELKSKTCPEEDHVINITETERKLFNLFRDNKNELEKLSENQSYENDSLSKLRKGILYEFSTRPKARGIIFTKSRQSAIALSHWIQENDKFDDIGVKASYLIGSGDQSLVKPMTPAEQKDVLNRFRNGAVNLLVATSVAEEGLDIPACNFVICYGRVTNEIAMIQSQGRARAKDSSYIVIEVKGSGVTEKESVNEYRKDLMTKAIAKICALDPADYNNRIEEFQLQAILEERVKMATKKKTKSEDPLGVKLSCRSCSTFVGTGDDIQIIEGMHHVNLSSQFSELYIQKENTSLQERLLDYETNGSIACKKCGQKWGAMMSYRGIDCPCLLVKNFVVQIKDKKFSNFTKWKEIPTRFQAFNYIEHASHLTDEIATL
ncbi:interferon-induced helicase C domain-containing protein 1 isoform X1 [Corythoichthys intestinalis]|uniref:interferon-induced helicase C domain-containing protein 1 isoform X1 n=1 Tax=Corythoichthys intestinalis TaxID=161448 RepID=UPI0025A5F1BD|nr:interferon-induced helicase C domain-containing protein 1 isoform X1 [Corythoichthys intestinalis]